MKDPRVVEIEFLSELEQRPPNSLSPWDYEKKLGVTREFFLDMVYGLFLDRCLEGAGSIHVPHPSSPYGGSFDTWGDHSRNQAVRSVLTYTSFTAHINHRGRVRLWQLRDEVQKGRTKEKFGILLDRRTWDADVAIHLAMKNQERKSAVLFMDLNNFKPVNDIYGHDIGDEVMRTYFQAVLNLAGADGDVYGWGGDEVVVFFRETDEASVEARVGAIKSAVSAECSAQPILAKAKHRISVACGAYVFAGSEPPAAIADAADRRMYEDKARMKANSEP